MRITCDPDHDPNRYPPAVELIQMAAEMMTRDLEENGGPSDCDFDWLDRQKPLSEALLHQSVNLDTKRDFDLLVRATAIMAFCPGGVKLFGIWYQAGEQSDWRDEEFAQDRIRDAARLCRACASPLEYRDHKILCGSCKNGFWVFKHKPYPPGWESDEDFDRRMRLSLEGVVR